MKDNGPITDMYQEYGLYDRFCLTKKGTLIGGVEIGGRDPDGLNHNDFTGLSLIARSLYQSLPDCVRSITQYYVHSEGLKVRLKDRKSDISSYLSKNRERFLNGKNLSGSRLIHLFEINPEENLAQLSMLNFVKHLCLSVKSKQSRRIIADNFQAEKTINIYADNLEKQRQDLTDLLEDVKARWDTIFDCRILGKSKIWAFFRFLANMEPEMMPDAEKENIPQQEWDLLLAEGDHYPVSIKGQDFLKFQNVENSYARMLSVTRLSEEVGEQKIQPGQWALKTHCPVRQKGNYIIMCRYAPLSKIRQAMMFRDKKSELYRKNMDIMSVIRGLSDDNRKKTGPGRFDNLKPAIAKKMKEIEDAEDLSEKWGHLHALIVTFGKDPESVNATLKALKKSVVRSGMSVVVESIDLPDAYKTIMPGGRESSARDIQVNTTQFGALSLIYKQAEGQIKVEDLRGEEAQYIFQSTDGSPFHYSPFCAGRCVVIGVGPIRSGKSFTKNTLGGHFVKYGGVYRAIDIDPGSEPLAQFYRDEGAIFRIGQGTNGFNSLKAVATGPKDYHFISHFKQMIMEMLKSNDTDQMRNLEMHEQQQLDKAIVATLNLPKKLQSLTSMVNHCPDELQQKLSRWYGKGFYASLFDQELDAVGSLDKPVVAFNLAGVKGDPVQLPLAISEITYRVTRLFEDPNYRHVPKYLDIDEAHEPLKIKYFRDYITRSIRTWGKWQAGIGLWSQDPSEFLNIPEWSVIRSAASTLFFMADPTLDSSLYKETFNLNAGEIEAIKELRPQKEAYVIQREIGVSKKIIVQVEPEQHVISTSKPWEADLREKLIARYGIEEGIQRAVKELNLNGEKAA